MELLHNRIQEYDWGSRTALAELLGLPSPAGVPQAELWMGAHPQAPSSVLRDGHAHSLLNLIDADPRALLGQPLVERFGSQLPFLLKILAADQPLSLQVHPSLEQAREGFAREDALGIPRNAPHRSYRDANHKPELICAITPMQALVGFRDPSRTLALADALGAPGLVALLQPLRGADASGGLRETFCRLMSLPRGGLVALLEELLPACERQVERAGAFAGEAASTLRLAERYPADAGVVVSLLLNLVTLSPGEAIYLGAGLMHAYLSGVGVEIMANSDNVLRCGLTSKHVDVAELTRILDFAPAAVSPLRATDDEHPAEQVYRTPAPDFRLSRVTVQGRVELARRGPEVLLCLEGPLTLAQTGASLTLGRGESAFVPALDPSYVLEGQGVLFRATAG